MHTTSSDPSSDGSADPTGILRMESTPPALERAQTLCDLSRFGEAAAALSALIATDPRNAGAWSLMARAQLGQEHDQAALQAAQAAISLAPGQEWPRRLASEALTRLGRYEEAASAAHEALRLAPHDWRPYAHLAHTLTHVKERLDEARTAAARAVEIAPGEVQCHIAAGAVAVAAGCREEAAEAFAQALAIDPQSSVAHTGLSGLRGRKRRIGGAVTPRLLPFRRKSHRLRRRRPSSQA